MKAYLSESEKRRRYFIFRVKLYLVFLCVALLGGGTIYALRGTTWFHVTDVDVLGLNERDADFLLADFSGAIENSFRKTVFGEESYFAWPTKLNTFSPYYQDVTVRKRIFSRSISISASPRAHFGAWCPLASTEERDCRWIEDGTGILLDRTPRPAGQILPTITEDTTETYEEGDIFLLRDEFVRLKTIIDGCRAIGLSLETIELRRDLDELQLTLSDGALIRFSLRFDPAINLSGLKEMLRKTPSIAVQEFDLTVPGKIYLERR